MDAICVDCEHFEQDGRPIWYNQRCRASELPKGRDPVSGKICHWGVNDLGTKYPSDSPFKYCRNVNIDGGCHLFKKK